MSYSNTGLRCLIPALGPGPAIWYYSSTDAHTDVDAADYFADGATFGLKANDVMLVVDTDSNTATIHKVTSATSVAVATLA
jgi:hypothetical protein